MQKSLISNSLSNLIGALFPAIFNLLTIPYIVRTLGDETYGILMLVTAIVGYFALLDINLTSGSIKFISEYNAVGKIKELHQVITLGGIIYFGIGLIGSLAIFLLSDVLVQNLFKIPDALVQLTIKTVRLSAFGFALGQLQAYLVSVPQALQRYDISAKFEAAFGAFIPIASVAVLWLGYGLYEVVLVRVTTSFAHVVILIYVCRLLLRDFRFLKPSLNIIKQLASFTGLAYLSKVAAIVYAHADKLIIGSLISIEGLAYYAVPATLVNRLLGMTFRLSSVVYPSASELKAKDDMASLKLIYFYAVKYVFFINAFFVLLICLFGREILNHWIGPNFSKEGSLVVVLIALAMLIDSITNIPSLVNDGFGHPRITGLFAIMRAALGLLAIFAFAKSYGIVGVAVGHLLSSAVMAATFTIYVHRHTIPFSLSLTVKHAYLPTFIASVVMGGAFLLFRPAHTLNLWQTMLVAATIATIMLLFGVRFVMDVTHRNAVISSIKKMISARSEGIR